MSPAALMERIYALLKERVTHGHYSMGARIDPASLARELTASVTPVRDALHRLVGERLVEHLHPAGFVVPTWNEPDLRDAYSWCDEILSLVLSRAAPARIAQNCSSIDLDPSHVAASTSRLFEAIALASDNFEHLHALKLVNERLHRVRSIEPIAPDQTTRELTDIQRHAGDEAMPELRRALTRFHRSRLKSVSTVIRLLRKPTEPGIIK